MKIIINADDFGIDIDRDLGIFYGVIKGYVTSVSIIVTNKIGWFRKLLVCIMKKKASIGIHINLTDNPLLKYTMEELCLKNYNYERRKFSFWRNSIDSTLNFKMIDEEINIKFEKFIKEYGFIPNHIDGHNHCNIFNKKVEELFENISIKYKIHLRIPYEDLEKFDKKLLSKNTFFKDFKILDDKMDINYIRDRLDYFFKYDMNLNNYMCIMNCQKDKIYYIGTMYGYFRNSNVLLKQLSNIGNIDCVQIMTHPGFYWKNMKHKTVFSNYDRKTELDSLRDFKLNSIYLQIDYTNYNFYQN